MENLLNKIKANIANRLRDKASVEGMKRIADKFNSEVIRPARVAYKELLENGEYTEEDFNDSENYLMAFDGNLKVSRLEGFDVVADRDDAYELYEIEADFSVLNDRMLILTASIQRSTYGEGSEVKHYELTLDGECVKSLLEETSEDGILDFIIENFQSGGFYDENQIEISESDVRNIAAILGVAA